MDDAVWFWLRSRRKFRPETASREIAARLRGLTTRTLFLRRSRKLNISSPTARAASDLREPIPGPIRRQPLQSSARAAGKEERNDGWSLKSRSPFRRAPIRYRLKSDSRLSPAPRINQRASPKSRDRPSMSSSRPKRKPVSGFSFKVRIEPMPARDNIPKDDDWNSTLVNATAALIVESPATHQGSRIAHGRGPQRHADPDGGFSQEQHVLSSRIVAAVRDALKNNELLPTDDGAFVAAQHAKLGCGGELRKLLGKDQLAALYASALETKWLTGEITEGRTTADLRAYVMSELQVEELDPERICPENLPRISFRPNR